MIRPLLKNRRYVCIACSFTQETQLLKMVEGDESSADRDLQNSNSSKYTVLIMDSSTLTIVQTVFHGNAPIGPLKSMAVVLPSQDMEKQSVMMIDSFGKVLHLPIMDSDQKRQNVPAAPKDCSISEVTDWADDSVERVSLVAFAKCGHVLALVHSSLCTFRQVSDGTVFGKISFLDSQLCSEDESYVIGGVFVEGDCSISSNDFVEDFVAWNTRGAAVVYRISYSGKEFKFNPVSIIPPVLHPADTKLSLSFIPLGRYVFRIESVCFDINEQKFWRPHVSIWHLKPSDNNHGKFPIEFEMFAEGNLLDDWPVKSSMVTAYSENHEFSKDGSIVTEEVSTLQDGVLPGKTDGAHLRDGQCVTHQGGQLVSSSMVISENYLAPYAVVYGFFSGDIEIVRFHMFFTALDPLSESLAEDADSQVQKQRLSGHKGAVLCLASHEMVSKSGRCSSNHVLLSGSKDCTVRVWDLDSGNPIIVLHQHVAPVCQIILPPRRSEYPWNDCFLTVGEDCCVTLASLHTLRVERLFPGHLYFPANVLWDGIRSYMACLCPNRSGKADSLDILYIWDVKTGARERVLRGAAAHSMFDHFLKTINESMVSENLITGNTSASSLVFPVIEPTKFSQVSSEVSGRGVSSQKLADSKLESDAPESSSAVKGAGAKSGLLASMIFCSEKRPIKSSSPFAGVSTLCFDLTSLMSLCSMDESFEETNHVEGKRDEKKDETGAGSSTPKDDAHHRANASLKEMVVKIPSPRTVNGKSSVSNESSAVTLDNPACLRSLEVCLLQFSLSFLHLWNVDDELDNLLISEMKLQRPDTFIVASGILGDRGSMTLTFPGSNSTLELWRSSPEYSALRSLTMVSLAQHLTSLYHSCSSASGALAAFYTRKFAEKITDIKPPLLQLLVSFWQNEIEHVKMAARSLFHCAASRAIPFPLCCPHANCRVKFHVNPSVTSEKEHDNMMSCALPKEKVEIGGDIVEEELEITSWLESYEVQDWISCVGGTTQDAMTSQIIVAAALAVWYASLVKPRVSEVVVHQLVKLVMAMNEKYSAAAAEILAEGMESTWKVHIGSEIPHLIGEIFFQVECVSGPAAKPNSPKPAPSLNIRETLVGILLPSLAMVDIPGFLHVIESQIWSTASDSPVHVASLMTLIRVVRGSPRNLAPYLDKVVVFILQTMDPGNSVMRRNCLKSSMTALKEVIRVFPMVALNSASSRLAVGDAIGEFTSASIRIYDMQSMSKIKILDASGPPGLPTVLGRTLEMEVTTAISALSFSPDGEGLVAFSENGLMIRWWSLESMWWEKLSRNLAPVQCTKLIFIPPWEGFSPNSASSSVMASILRDDGQINSPKSSRASGEVDRLKLLVHNLDLSYRLEWVGNRQVMLLQHSREIGTFQL
ncbi:uncharacterized protein LOC127265582 isoform X2 [Andrographis paniculata]|nr:uncharacterized protein LOC127265582 isoform X2 [Andrographis paniculata]